MGNGPAKAGGRSGREGFALAGQIKVEAVKEHERAYGLHGGGPVLLLVNLAGQIGQDALTHLRGLLFHALQAGQAAGIVDLLAQLHLQHQEGGRHGRVVFGADGRAVQLAQVGGAPVRVFQAAVGLIDAG